jgi:hypothetical protein
MEESWALPCHTLHHTVPRYVFSSKDTKNTQHPTPSTPAVPRKEGMLAFTFAFTPPLK